MKLVGCRFFYSFLYIGIVLFLDILYWDYEILFCFVVEDVLDKFENIFFRMNKYFLFLKYIFDYCKGNFEKVKW